MKLKQIIYLLITAIFLTLFCVILWQKNRFMPIGNKSILDKNTGKIYTIKDDQQIENDVINKTRKISTIKMVK